MALLSQPAITLLGFFAEAPGAGVAWIPEQNVPPHTVAAMHELRVERLVEERTWPPPRCGPPRWRAGGSDRTKYRTEYRITARGGLRLERIRGRRGRSTRGEQS
jgi:hypothetical protein